MADFLDEIADKLATAGVGTVATTSNTGDIFIGILPATPDNCIALFGLPGSTIGDQREVAALQFPRFQVVARNVSYASASTKLQAVRTALHGIYDVQLANWRVLRCHAEQEGGPIGEDDQGRFEFTVNFVAEIHANTPTP